MGKCLGKPKSKFTDIENIPTELTDDNVKNASETMDALIDDTNEVRIRSPRQKRPRKAPQRARSAATKRKTYITKNVKGKKRKVALGQRKQQRRVRSTSSHTLTSRSRRYPSKACQELLQAKETRKSPAKKSPAKRPRK
ncbi:hypothetical protein GJ496_002609 [Pomphorhynchus laevis]|nr:hypothetical protein GJ496_002609 [Pomphorhynchus laevis]